MADTRSLVERLREWAEDPMWADHVEMPKAYLRKIADRIEALETALAASQAREAKMREVLEEARHYVDCASQRQVAGTTLAARGALSRIDAALRSLTHRQGVRPPLHKEISMDGEQIAADLRAAMEGATPGPYEGRDGRGLEAPAACIDFAIVGGGREVSRVWTEADARFGALCSPDRITALLAELDTLRKRVEELEAASDDPNLQVLVEDLRPYAERQIGSLRIDMSDVRSILALFDASRTNKEDGNG